MRLQVHGSRSTACHLSRRIHLIHRLLLLLLLRILVSHLLGSHLSLLLLLHVHHPNLVLLLLTGIRDKQTDLLSDVWSK